MVRLIRDGEKGGKGVWRWGKREEYNTNHHQNDSCIKMGSDESHFNVSVGSDGQSHKRKGLDGKLALTDRPSGLVRPDRR